MVFIISSSLPLPNFKFKSTLQNSNHQNPTKPLKNSIWVNPKTLNPSRLLLHSSDSSYARLVLLAQSLSSLSPSAFVQSLSDAKLSTETASIVLSNTTDPQTTLSTLNWILCNLKTNRKSYLYNNAFKVLRKFKDLDCALKVFDDMRDRGVTPENVTFSTLIGCAMACGLPNEAVGLFERMFEYECDPDCVIYSVLIDGLGRAGMVEKALEIYDKARGKNRRLDVVTFASVIRVYVADGNFEGALNVFEEMKAVGVRPNVVVYNAVLDMMGRARRPWQVKAIYEEMESNAVSPNRVTYALLVKAFCRVQQVDNALRVYKDAKGKGVEFNVVLYNTILSLCVEKGLVNEAFEVFDDLKGCSKGCKPDIQTFSTMIKLHSYSRNVSEAENVLNQMLLAGLKPTIIVLMSLIQCYSETKRTDDIIKTFHRVMESGITPNDRFCSCLLDVLARTPQEEVEKVIFCIKKANNDLGLFIMQLVDVDVSNKAFRIESEELFSKIHREVIKSYCDSFINICVNLNLMERASVIMELAIKLGIYNAIQSKSSTQWSLHLKGLSVGAGVTALHIWTNDLTRTLVSGGEFPPLLGIQISRGKCKTFEGDLDVVLELHMRESKAPFHKSVDRTGWFLTTREAAMSWLDSRISAN